MKNTEILGVAAVVAIILGILMSAMNTNLGGAATWLFTGKDTLHHIDSQSPASGSSVVGAPSITAQQIDTILANAVSPASGTGQDLYNLGKQYNIDPAFALAVFFNESNFGKAGEAAFTRSLGNLRPVPDEAFERDGYAAFYSWRDGYESFYKLISGPVYAGSGKTTVELIIPIYAPSGDGNSPSHYIGVVESAMSLWRSGSTGVPA